MTTVTNVTAVEWLEIIFLIGRSLSPINFGFYTHLTLSDAWNSRKIEALNFFRCSSIFFLSRLIKIFCYLLMRKISEVNVFSFFILWQKYWQKYWRKSRRGRRIKNNGKKFTFKIASKTNSKFKPLRYSTKCFPLKNRKRPFHTFSFMKVKSRLLVDLTFLVLYFLRKIIDRIICSMAK